MPNTNDRLAALALYYHTDTGFSWGAFDILGEAARASAWYDAALTDREYSEAIALIPETL